MSVAAALLVTDIKASNTKHVDNENVQVQGAIRELQLQQMFLISVQQSLRDMGYRIAQIPHIHQLYW